MKTVQFFSSIESSEMENHNIEQGVYLNRPAMTDLERDEAKERRKTRLLCAVNSAKITLMCCVQIIVPVATFLIVWYLV